ncbi:large-conductance mechanosensitive channel [Neobacillus ginsengisoli]|uniref:Large-conductance mechanosensitive channel n=1 Tax=Neobacillus ginsengisoli TaxID=904295 RepID=A0ABT9Y224_9BACI|nr:large-conductance mechanosensitive channel [Neobacillus ginsengisoli]
MNNYKVEALIRLIILFLSLAFGLLLHKVIFFIIGAIILILVSLYFNKVRKRSSKE